MYNYLVVSCCIFIEGYLIFWVIVLNHQEISEFLLKSCGFKNLQGSLKVKGCPPLRPIKSISRLPSLLKNTWYSMISKY
ncbi:hypothetical protein DSECCO2_388500 [anaerobic digester metagenome]